MEPLLSAEELSVGWWFLIPFAGALLALILTETGASTSWCRPGTATRARVAIAGAVGAVNVHWLAVELLAETAQSTSRTLSLVSGGAMGLAAIIALSALCHAHRPAWRIDNGVIVGPTFGQGAFCASAILLSPVDTELASLVALREDHRTPSSGGPAAGRTAHKPAERSVRSANTHNCSLDAPSRNCLGYFP